MNNWTLNGITFTVTRGNLAETSADAVALGVSADWTPAGPSTGAIIRAADSDLPEHIEGLDTGSPGETAVVSAGQLPADRIILTVLQSAGETRDDQSFLSGCFDNVLQTAEDRGDIEYLALQPLGSNDFNHSLNKVTASTVETLLNRSSTLEHLNHVEMVVYDAIDFNSAENFARETLQKPDEDTTPDPRDYV